MDVARGEQRSPLLVTIGSVKDEEKAGVGFLIDDRHVLTCAHVVYDGGWIEQNATSAAERSVLITIEGQTVPLETSVVLISRPKDNGQIDEKDDICVLELKQPVAGFDPDQYPVVIRRDLVSVAVRALGVPEGAQAAGLPITAVTQAYDLYGRVSMRTSEGSPSIAPGFSGAPVLRQEGEEVIGMIVSCVKSGTLSYMLPIQLIAQLVRERKPEFTLAFRLQAEQDYPHVAKLHKFAAKRLGESIGHVSLQTHLVYCNTYEELTQIHRGAAVQTPRYMPGELLGSGELRVYVQAPGGAGKTAYLMHFLAQAIERGLIAFYLDIKNAGSLPQGEKALEVLFQRCAEAAGTYPVFGKVRDDSKYWAVLIVDGLNESRESMQRVRDVLDEVSRSSVRLHILAADRLTGSSAPPSGFERATIAPLELEAITDPKVTSALKSVQSDKFRKLLTIPFFLDTYLDLRNGKQSGRKLKKAAAGRAGILRAYFEKHLGGSAEIPPKGLDGAIQTLALHAYTSYATPDQGLRIPRTALEHDLPEGARVMERLVTAGIFVEDTDTVTFRHQLLHDFLVAEHLRILGLHKWRIRTFDAATFGASAFEALEFASELLEDQADNFIIEVYDWNYAASLECVLNLAAGNTGQESPVSAGLRDALFAMFAEKRFDHFRHTRDKAQRKAAQFSSQFGIDYAAIATRDALVEEVKSHFQTNAPPMLKRWLEVFSSLDPPPPKDWPLLQDSPLLAWTAANTFRRSAGPDRSAFTAYLCQLYNSLRTAQLAGDRALVTRWRITHVLGTADDRAAVEILAAAIKDKEEHHWVRYGAVRSLVEAASRSPNAREAQRILRHLKGALRSLRAISAFQEVRDVAILAGTAPRWWASVYGSVLESGIVLLADEAERSEDPVLRQRAVEQQRAWELQLEMLAGKSGTA